MKHSETQRLCLLLLLIMSSLAAHAQIKISFETELERLSNIGAFPRYLEGSQVRQISSYDTTGGNDDGFGGKYSYLRKEPGGGLVIFDQKGQGVIERIWTPTPTDDTLDFYFDGNKRPGLSIKFRDLFNNSTIPFRAPIADHKVGGFYSYIPIPYKNGCKIVFRGEKILFHQIQYRAYDDRYQVQTFQKQLTGYSKQLLDRAIMQWSDEERSVFNFYKPGQVRSMVKQMELQPGGVAQLFKTGTGGRILGIELGPTRAFAGAQKSVDLKISWDDDPEPAVYAPVADFFGFAYGTPSMNSLLLGATQAKNYCYIPMPFDKKASVELINRSMAKDQKSIRITATVYYADEPRHSDKEGRFYAYWKNEASTSGQPYVFLEGNGKGQYIGTVLQGQATDGTNFTEYFEGDDSTVIDGQMIAHGTGSEDYFNGGWYAQPGGWVERLGAPLSGCLDYSLPLGRTGGYRFFLADKMPFYHKILHTIEHGPVNNNRPVNYISVGMYYADQSIATATPPDNAATQVYTPDTVTFYTRLMHHLSYNGSLQLTKDVALLSGNDDASLNINVTEIPPGKYSIYLHQLRSGTDKIEVKVAGDRNPQSWNGIIVKPGNGPANLLIGTAEIGNNAVPVNILFKSKAGTPDFAFDRVMFVKTP